MLFLKSLLSVFLISLLLGCGEQAGSPGDSLASDNQEYHDEVDEETRDEHDSGVIGVSGGLTIGSIDFDLSHYHPSYYQNRAMLPMSPMGLSYAVEISWENVDDDIYQLYIRNKLSGFQEYIVDGLYPELRIPKEQFFNEDTQSYGVTYYDEIARERVNLRHWEIVAVSTKGYSVRKDFDFILPGGDDALDDEFIYSYAHSGSIQGGYEALEVMSTVSNQILFSSNFATQSFRIAFSPTDTRVADYSIDFHDNAYDYRIGRVPYYSSSIQSMAIIPGQRTVIDIPWSEIIFNYGYSIHDVKGLHIRLYDEPVQVPQPVFHTLDEHNYLSVSEYVELDN